MTTSEVGLNDIVDVDQLVCLRPVAAASNCFVVSGLVGL
jgi:hypothetical protein